MEKVMRQTLLLACLTMASSSIPAAAEPVFEVLGAYTAFAPDQLEQVLEIRADMQLDVVVLLHSPESASSAAEFVITDLVSAVPGVIKINEQTIHPDPVIPPWHPSVEYVMGFGQCAPAGTHIELLRVTYFTFGVEVPADTIVQLRGFKPGDSLPSSFGGRPGILDCDDGLLPGVMGGHDEVISDARVVCPEGALFINPTRHPHAAGEYSMGMIKSRY